MLRPVCKYFKTNANTNKVTAWKPKGLSDETIKSATMDTSLNPGTTYIDNAEVQVNFDGSCLKQNEFPFNSDLILTSFLLSMHAEVSRFLIVVGLVWT